MMRFFHRTDRGSSRQGFGQRIARYSADLLDVFQERSAGRSRRAPATASRITYLLAALSRACHYHSYELTPTAAELTSRLDQAAQLVTQLHAASTVPAH
jgi:hypothetical protein